MKRVVPLLLAALMVSGFRAFPSLSEQDPHAVFDSFQTAVSHMDSMDDLYRYLSARKRHEYERKIELAQATPGAADKIVDGIRQNFYLMHPTLAAEEIHKTSAILVYKGAVSLNGVDYVDATMGVLLVKEDGDWKVDRDKITYKIDPDSDNGNAGRTGRKAL